MHRNGVCATGSNCFGLPPLSLNTASTKDISMLTPLSLLQVIRDIVLPVSPTDISTRIDASVGERYHLTMLQRSPESNLRSPQQTVGQYFDELDYTDRSLIVVPGTSDADGATLMQWMRFLVDKFPEDRRSVVDYPASVAPLIGGWHGYRYDESKAIARERTKYALETTEGPVDVLAYSQGSDGAWEGVVEAVEEGLKDPGEIRAILGSHPGYPGGLKDVMRRKHRITSKLFKYAFHAEMNGVWTPHPDIDTTLLAVRGDPVTHMDETTWPNLYRFASRFHAGFYQIHSGLGYESMAQLEQLSIASRATDPYYPATKYLEMEVTSPVEQRRYQKKLGKVASIQMYESM